MGIRSPISRNPSMILGGLSTGVSALDMAHAYSTVANGGVKVFNPVLGDVDGGPIGIDKISNCGKCAHSTITNWGTMKTDRVLSPEVDATLTELLHGPVDDSYGTGTAAAIPGVDVAGKTGTTSNYVDAWFVGYTPTMTVAVWVGYPNSGKPMTDLYYGRPVEGGTFPAVIFHNYVTGRCRSCRDEASNRKAAADTVTTLTPTYTGPPRATGTGLAPPTNFDADHRTTARPDERAAPSGYGERRRPRPRQNSTTPSSNQTETLPQTNTPPPSSSGWRPPAAPTTGGSGL